MFDFLIPRLAFTVVMTTVGFVIGRVLGGTGAAPGWLAWIGACTGAAVSITAEIGRSNRLLDWLRGGRLGAAPRDQGISGELAYRIERALRNAQNALLQEESRLEQFLSGIEASPNGVMLLDGDEQIEWCNRVAADHFGLDPHRDRQQRVTNLVRMPAFVTYLQQGDFTEPLTVTSPRGDSTLSLLIRSYGNGQRLVLSQDITERIRADAMRRDFVANVSHEIRTPLTVLAGFIETMSSIPLTEVERKRVLGLMAQQTQRMQSLVSDLLTLAQLEGSPRPAADRWVAVSQLLAQIENDALGLSHGRHTLSFTPTSDPVVSGAQIAGVEGELHSALTNLVSNAVRYTPEQGHIQVTWRLLPDGNGEFAVRDDGIGIAREHIPRLTERFYRVDVSRARETGGTGLGLSIVKHVAQRHGGELAIDSEPGKGSLFRLVLPAGRVRYLEPAPDPRRAAGEQAVA